METIGTPYHKIINGLTRKYSLFLCPKCGEEVEKRIDNGLESKTCGCGKNDHKKKHNGSETRLYGIWSNMKDRCYNPSANRYKTYGGRGISICHEWISDFSVFRKWAESNGYKRGLHIDRIDNDGNYDPPNCRFTTLKENNRRRTDVKLSMEKAFEIRSLYSAGGYSQRKLGEMFGVHQWRIWKVLKNEIWIP